MKIFIWQTVLFSVGIFVVAFVLRRTVEGLFPALSRKTAETYAQRVWEKVILPILAPVLGGAGALVVPDLVHPDITTVRSQVLFGLVCGFFSSSAYRFVKALIEVATKRKLGEVTGKEGDSIRPEKGTSEAPPENGEDK